MAFVGVPVITSLGKNTVRITGLSIAGNNAGTIGFNGDAGADVTLPASFPSDVFECGAVDGLTLVDVIRSWFVHTNPGGGGESRHIHVDKAIGPPFRITYTNDQGTATSTLEIWVELVHTVIR